MSEINLRCFVIMPFSRSSENHTEDYWTNHFRKFLKPLIEEIPGIEAYRVESLHGDILKQIITDLVVAPIVVAELTDHNPNVFWELGVRQSFKHNTITIAEEGTPLPFDVSSKATLFYSPNDHLRMEEFRGLFKKALIDCSTSSDKTDSYVLETISGRGTLFEIMRFDEAKRRIESLIEETEGNQIAFNDFRNFIKKYNAVDVYLSTAPYAIFQTQSAELLLSSRYIDEDLLFYKTLRNYYNLLNNARNGLALFNTFSEEEKFHFMKGFKQGEKGSINKLFKHVLSHLERIHKNLSKKASIYSSGIVDDSLEKNIK
ncbi:MAG: hypothetical protein ACFE96_01000 [Candidatus Hermodarchaeota archaeon]